MVMERHDTERRGKGFALAYAMDRLLAEGLATAIVVVDADTLVSPGLLRAFAARLERGESALQARYSVRNPDASWRTQLMVIAMALMNDTRAFARERLGLSATLAGNGMCFSADLLRRRPYHAFSIVEDLEYGLLLGQGGWRVGFVGEAMVRGDMLTGGGARATQRLRWEAGRRAMVRTHGWPMLQPRPRHREQDRLRPGGGAPGAAPGPPRRGGRPRLGAGGGLDLVAPGVTVGAWLWWLTLPALFLYVARGWWLSGTGLAGLAALARAPLPGLEDRPLPEARAARTGSAPIGTAAPAEPRPTAAVGTHRPRPPGPGAPPPAARRPAARLGAGHRLGRGAGRGCRALPPRIGGGGPPALPPPLPVGPARPGPPADGPRPRARALLLPLAAGLLVWLFPVMGLRAPGRRGTRRRADPSAS